MDTRAGHRPMVVVLGAALLITLIVVSYYPALNGPFLLDDATSVAPAKIDRLTLEELRRVVGNENSGMFGRSIPAISFALNHYFSDGDAYSFKVTNLLIHIINACLLFMFFRLLQSRLSLADSTDTLTNELIFICVAAWAIHPLQVSTVMYVVQRMAMLATLFSLSALVAYLMVRSREQGVLRSVGFALTGLFTILACLCKESGALVVLYIILIEFFIFTKNGKTLKQLVYRKWVLITIPVVIWIFYFYVNSERGMQGYEVRDFGLYERIITETTVVVFYLKMILLPNLMNMTLYHDGYPIFTAIDSKVLMSGIILVCLGVIAFLSYQRYKYIAFGIGVFLISHALESTIIPLELVFEHRNYFALAGIVLAVFYSVWRFTKKYGNPSLLYVIAIGVIGMLSLQTHVRAMQWSDEWGMHQYGLEAHPKSVRNRNAVTRLLAGKGDLRSLVQHLDDSIEAIPNRSHFKVQKVTFSSALGMHDKTLLEQAVKSLNTQPVQMFDGSALLELYGFYAQGRLEWPNLVGLTELFEAAVNNNQKRLGADDESVVVGHLAVLLSANGREEEAVLMMEHSVELEPIGIEPRLRLLRLYVDTNRDQQAQQLLAAMSDQERLVNAKRISEITTGLSEVLISEGKE